MSGGGGGKGGGSQTTGYRYFFGIHMGLGRGPVDEIVQIKVGDKTAWQGSVKENSDITIDQYNLFGGEGKEGGIQGTLQVMMGEATQTASSGLLGMLGAPLPGFRRMVTAFFDGLVAMNNPYPKAWKFRMRRALKGWDGPVFEPGLALIPVKADGQTFTVGGGLGAAVLGFAMARNVQNNSNHFADYATYNTSNPDPYLFGQLGVPVTAAMHSYNNASAPGDSGVAPTSTVPIDPDGEYELTVQNGYWPDPGCEGRLEFINAAGNVIAAVAIVGVSAYTIYLYAGNDLNNLFVKDFFALSRSSPLLFQENQLLFLNNTFPCAAKTIRSVRMSGFRARLSYTGTSTNGAHYIIFKQKEANLPPVPGPADPTGINSMNPAHIIYECLTNREWGRGFDSALLDTASFTTCAQKLYDETFGLCLKWSRSDSIESFVQSVLDHIGATLFTSRRTGLITLRLIRNDYVQSELPLFDVESGLLRITESTVSAQGSGVNQVEVTYRDPLTDEDLVVKVDNIAAIQTSNGNVNKLSKEYTGLPTAALALRVAQRDLRAASSSLRRFSMVLDRRGRSIEPGGVIRIRDASRGIPETVVRVGRIDDGTVTSGEITVTAVQDVFALPVSSYGTSVDNTWTPPNTTPCLDIHRVIEMPYFMVNRTTSAADLAMIDPAAGFIGTMVAEGQSMNVGHKIAVRDSAPTAEDYPTETSQYCGFVPDWTP